MSSSIGEFSVVVLSVVADCEFFIRCRSLSQLTGSTTGKELGLGWWICTRRPMTVCFLFL